MVSSTLSVLLVVLSASLAIAQGPANLLSNGDAEQGPLGQAPPHWRQSGYDGIAYPTDFDFQTVTPGRQSAKAIRLQRPARLKWAYGEQTVRVRFDDDVRYVLRVWVRAERPMPHALDLALLSTSRATKDFLPEARQCVDLDRQWRPYSLELLAPALPGSPEVGLRVIFQLYEQGAVFFDDAELVREPLSPAEKARMAKAREIYAKHLIGVNSPIGPRGGIVVAADGRLLAFTDSFGLRASADGGRTWSRQQPLPIPDCAGTGPLSGALVLRSGTICVWTEPTFFWSSRDGGRSWSKRIQISPTGRPLHGNVMIETGDGRLVLPVRDGNTVHQGLWEGAGAFGTVGGRRVLTEGHAHALEMDVSYVYYSSNGGQSWQRSEGQIIIWKDDGYGGMWPCDEPNVVELRDARLLIFLRTTLGRIYQTISTDGGRRWQYPEPTQLPASYSPCSLKRIPKNASTEKTGRAGDLLCVWNNVSNEEIKRGFRRGRLSSAISRDDGKTWTHVKTIDAAGVPPRTELAPLSPPGMVRAAKDLGELPMPFGNVDYPDVTFVGDQILVKYDKKLTNPPIPMSPRLQILPLDWFYQR